MKRHAVHVIVENVFNANLAGHYVAHRQEIGEHGVHVCELAHFFFHYQSSIQRNILKT